MRFKEFGGSEHDLFEGTAGTGDWKRFENDDMNDF
jgi:hypothetical protein